MTNEIQDFAPIELKTNKDKAPVEQVHLFSIDGKPYYAKTGVPFTDTLKAMKVFRERGEEAAQFYAIELVLGEEGFEALTRFEDLTEEQFESILAYADKVVIGPGKDQKPSKPQPRGGARSRGSRSAR